MSVKIIGVPKEIKNQEYRVGLVPGSVRELVAHGNKVIVETNAGMGIGATDDDYKTAGATIAKDAKEIFQNAEIVVKVKEPQPVECKMLHENQILFTYLHLAPDPVQTKGLIESKCTAIAYETVTDNRGRLPLLNPMSEVAGRLSIQAGTHYLEKKQGGAGVLLGGVPGVTPGRVVVIGGGVVGTNAIIMAIGLGAQVTVLDKSIERLQELSMFFGSKIHTIYANTENVEKYVVRADLVIGAVLIPGAAAPRIITRPLLRKMRPGSVFVDVAIDQGGCAETSHATTHDNPVYIEEGVIHYCVANMPGAVPRTSAYALNNATLPFTIALANKGVQALRDNPHLLNGLNVHKGHITYEIVAKDLNLPFIPPLEALKK